MYLKVSYPPPHPQTYCRCLALLVALPCIGVVTVLCVGMLVLQKLRLQTRLDDNCWWLVKYSDIVIIKEPKV